MLPTHLIHPASRGGTGMAADFWSRQARDLGLLDVAKRRDPANVGGTWTAAELELADALDDAYLADDLVGFGHAALFLADDQGRAL